MADRVHLLDDEHLKTNNARWYNYPVDCYWNYNQNGDWIYEKYYLNNFHIHKPDRSSYQGGGGFFGGGFGGGTKVGGGFGSKNLMGSGSSGGLNLCQPIVSSGTIAQNPKAFMIFSTIQTGLQIYNMAKHGVGGIGFSLNYSSKTGTSFDTNIYSKNNSKISHTFNFQQLSDNIGDSNEKIETVKNKILRKDFATSEITKDISIQVLKGTTDVVLPILRSLSSIFNALNFVGVLNENEPDLIEGFLNKKHGDNKKVEDRPNKESEWKYPETPNGDNSKDPKDKKFNELKNGWYENKKDGTFWKECDAKHGNKTGDRQYIVYDSEKAINKGKGAKVWGNGNIRKAGDQSLKGAIKNINYDKLQ